MSISLKIVLFLIVATYIILLLNSVKKNKMKIGYLIIWITIGAALTISLLLPNFVENISKLIGFEMPINMIFSIAIFVIIYLIYGVISLISEVESKNVMLIQEVSLLKKRIDELEKNNKEE